MKKKLKALKLFRSLIALMLANPSYGHPGAVYSNTGLCSMISMLRDYKSNNNAPKLLKKYILPLSTRINVSQCFPDGHYWFYNREERLNALYTAIDNIRVTLPWYVKLFI